MEVRRPAIGRSVLVLALSLLAVWVQLTGAQTPSIEPAARHVVVLSLDGARADAVRAALPPALTARGAVSWTAQTVQPSLTLPAHVSSVSGVGPAVHRVTFNDWREGQPYLQRATVFTEVTRAGGRAAGIVNKLKLLMFMPEGSVASARHLVYPRFRQAEVVEAASRYFVEQRPAFLLVHVADPDDRGHARGWMSEEYLRVIAGTPSLIERLMRAFEEAGVTAHALLIVTADHGGHGVTHGTSRPEDMTIPWLAFGGAARPGVVLERRIVISDTAATALAALGLQVPADWQGQPVWDALQAR